MNAINLKTVVIDGVECQMPDMAAIMVQRTMNALQTKLQDANKKIKEMEEDDEDDDEESEAKDAAIVAKDKLLKAKDDALRAKDGEIAARDGALKAKDEELKVKDGEIAAKDKAVKDAEMTPAKLNALVLDRLGVIQKAKAIMGDTYKVGAKTIDEIRKDIVVAKMGDEAKDWDVSTIKGAFHALGTVRQYDAVPSHDTIDVAIEAFGGGGRTSGRPGAGYNRQDPVDAAYAAYDTSLQDAWKGAQHKDTNGK